MGTRTLFLTSLLLFLCLGVSPAQERYRFRTLSPAGGFYYDGVKSIREDAEGFIWVVMDNEVHRFDGYSYKRYYPKFKELLPEAQWTFGQLGTDSNGQLYISTNNGIFTYSRLKDTFEFALDVQADNFFIDKEDHIWIPSSRDLYRIDPVTMIRDTITCNGAPIRNIMSFDPVGKHIYMASAYGRVMRYDYASGETESIYDLPSTHNIVGISYDEGNIWVLTSAHGLFCLEENTRRMSYHEFYLPYGQPHVPARKLLNDKNGNLWIATQAGIWVFDPQTGSSTHYENSNDEMFSIPNNSVWSLFEDRRRNIWIGTFSGGLCVVDLDEPEVFRTITQNHTGLNHSVVSAFAQDGRTVWIGTEGGGISMFDMDERVVKKNISSQQGGPTVNNIKSIVPGPDGKLWLGMFLGGLDRYDPISGYVKNYNDPGPGNKSIRHRSLRKIIRNGDRGLWIIYQQAVSTVSYYSFRDDEFTHHRFDETDDRYYLFDIVKGYGDDLWMISSKNLYRFDTNTNTARNILADTIPYLNARSLCIDGKGVLWIGTLGHGLLRYNPSDGSIISLGALLDFDVSAVYSIIADNDDNIWMGTDNGLVMYRTAEGRFVRFDETDGLQGQVYCPLACMKTTDGILFFGGTNGFTTVNPENIRENPHPPKVIISEFLLDNSPSLLQSKKEGVYRNDNIVLPYRQTNFGFTFSADNYLVPLKNRFRYRLVGYDNRWTTADALNRNVIFTKVPAGNYRFEIQASNNDGVWGPVTTIAVLRRAAPWATTFAFIAYAVIITLIATVMIRFYLQRKKLKLELYKDKLEKQQKEEIHQSQLRFFTNISHDFRTPLSLIQGVVDNLRNEEIAGNYYRILHSNTQRLLSLVNELLDFRSLQHGKVQLQVIKLDLNRLMESIASDFDNLARQKVIRFTKKTDPLMPDLLYADRQVVEKIIMNLLNNSFKYTSGGGEISIETYCSSKAFEHRHESSFTVGDPNLDGFAIAVRDTGVGISAATIDSVFDRYYNVKTTNLDSHLGTGIGLALVKSLVELHKGSITICSTRGSGTDMLVVLPSDPTVYTPDQFSDQITEDIPVPTTSPAESRIVESIKSGEAKNVMLRERKRILIVEDNNDLRKLMADYLSPHYDVEQAVNGFVASRYLDDHEVNLIISDIMMPVKDGITLCRELKADVNTSHIPLLMLTAKTGLASKIEGAESGADHYFEKPLDLGLLLITVRNIFDQQDKMRNYYAKNYYVDSAELAANENDNQFLKKLVGIIDANLSEPIVDVHLIAHEMSMSRTKLYSKLKALTGKSIVEFTLNYRLRKAAKLIIEEDLTMKEVMDRIGIRSQSYFTNTFKKEFGDTPSAFARKHNHSKKRSAPDPDNGDRQ